MSIIANIKRALPSLPPSPPPHQLSNTVLLNMACIIAVPVVMHFSIANPAVGIFTALIYLLKTATILFNKTQPPKALIVLLTIAGFGLVLVMYGGWNGHKAGISYLVLLLALKFLESKTLRDYYMVCLILYFITATSFLFDTSMTMIIAVISYSIIITGLMIRLSNPVLLPWFSSAKEAGWIIVKALPLTILLFFFFPRIQSDFGFLPTQDNGAERNQLNNSLVAGDFARSAFSKELAFRVEFDDKIPSNRHLYWRSKVMTIESNFQWFLPQHSVASLRGLNPPILDNIETDNNYRYRILHEPSTDNFVPYLDYPSYHSLGNLLPDFSVYRFKPDGKAFAYTAESILDLPTLPEQANSLNSQLITQTRPTAKALALLTQWKAQAQNNRDLVDLVYQHFKQTNFRYSLAPPELGNAPFNDFMFNTQVGYCEHYASAFTTIMRWLQIPARVVVGFQGGRFNKTGNYLEVRYSDAHAWSEVWLDQRWVRIDPTSAISPERIEFGMEALLALLENEDLASGNISGLSDYLAPKGLGRLLEALQDRIDNVGYQWNKWIVNYDFDKQKELLEQLGLKHQNSLYTLITILLLSITAFLLFYFWQLIPKALVLEDSQRVYLQFVNRFKKHKLIKQPADTPNTFADKAIEQFPSLESDIRRITEQYLMLRYQRDQNTSIKQFKQLVKQFRIKSK